MTDTISVHDITHDLIPRFQATERLVDNTLQDHIERCANAAERVGLEELQAEFELKLTMIRMNLEHLMSRYAQQMKAARQGGGNSNASLTLDAHETVAVESARMLYRRAQELAT
ncbi:MULTISPECIES: hypothetical protein [Halomonas]|uniref:Uncharacterized protein n=1 Tax=Halomonas halophila TaxID=29573 RepID=A0ABQ0U6F8_9GAMM|nr:MULTISPECIES: hypothetical protein [Halomonas]MDR5889036.1 hypothetical protein [Halomonas salina]WJY07403.1 hypothetical protein QWG60_00450 [Halomonas halophila]GEK74043.1 hypothetical protein HHA04nite_25870 [Halomonas halophila]